MKGDGTIAEVLMASSDLAADMTFFREQIGLRLDSIFPADDPAEAVLCGHGVRIRLQRGAVSSPGVIRLLCKDPHVFGETVLRAPNGTRVELHSLYPPLHCPPVRHELVVHRRDAGGWHQGRAGMQYRDLIPGRLGGAVVASHIRIPQGGPVADDVHYHIARFQLIFCYRGWVELVYEDQGPPFRLEAGDCLIQPPQIRHRVLESAAGLEVIEIAAPAEHLTCLDHALRLPTDRIRQQRDFGGQRFCRHQSKDAIWKPARLPGFASCETGVGEATRGLADAMIMRPSRGATRLPASHDADVLFTFVLEGTMTLRLPGQSAALQAGDVFVVPPGIRHTHAQPGDTLELLEICMPGNVTTTLHHA